MQKKSTIRDVAAHAGVSIATVSRYINGTQRFSDDVEDRIRDAIRQLHYQVPVQLRPASSTTPKTIGLIVFLLNGPTFPTVLKGMSRAATKNGYGLVILEKSELIPPEEKARLTVFGYGIEKYTPLTTEEKERLEEMGRTVDGFLVSARISQPTLDYIRKYDKPILFFGSGPRPDLPVVGSDSYRAARLLGELLVGQGHRRLAYVGIPESPWSEERKRGLADLVRESDLPLLLLDVRDVSRAEVSRVSGEILEQRPDAIVCYNDLLALMLLQELAKRGLSVPGDVSVAGIDNTACGLYSTPTLTTVDMQSENYGELAMQLLLRRIREGVSSQIGRVLLEPRLVLRNSTRPR
jgi:LacI family transcriptional regulator